MLLVKVLQGQLLHVLTLIEVRLIPQYVDAIKVGLIKEVIIPSVVNVMLDVWTVLLLQLTVEHVRDYREIHLLVLVLMGIMMMGLMLIVNNVHHNVMDVLDLLLIVMLVRILKWI